MSDVRQDPEVRSTLQEMGLSIYQIWKMGDGDLAFWMMDQCIDRGIGDFTCLCAPTAVEIINIAVNAWKGAKE